MMRRWYAVDDYSEMVYIFKSSLTQDKYINEVGSAHKAGKLEALRKINMGYGSFVIDRFFGQNEPVKGVDF